MVGLAARAVGNIGREKLSHVAEEYVIAPLAAPNASRERSHLAVLLARELAVAAPVPFEEHAFTLLEAVWKPLRSSREVPRAP